LDAAAPLPRNLPPARAVGKTLEGELSAELPALRVTLRRLAAGAPGLDADDLLQDTVQRALRYRDSYDPRHPLGAWLQGIALRVFLYQRARQRRAPRALGEGDAAVVAEGGGRPAMSAPDALLAADLQRLLARLPAVERDALERFHLRGQSIAEIARAHDAAEGTVKSWLHRARRRLAAGAREEDWL
jgi:RNA polymerase sigma-70 factor (ECF subfamily)